MAFTYDLTTDVGLVRFELDDTVEGAGVRPDDRNISDAEIQMLVDREGTVMRAVAAACEMLARAWAKAASYSTGQRSEQIGAVAKEWADRARELRGQYGGASGYAFSVSLDREDGYSDNADTASEFTS